MPHRMMMAIRHYAVAIVILSFVILTVSMPLDLKSEQANRLAQLPKTILWAWDRPEQLDFIDSQQMGVAYVARRLILSGESIINIPRRTSLRLPLGVQPVAVVHIDVDSFNPPLFTFDLQKKLLTILLSVAEIPGIAALQIDFEAKPSQRSAYKNLLTELRHSLPVTMPLSITALASWCMEGDWLNDWPVDEVVPMLFRMGADGNAIRVRLAQGVPLISSRCRQSFGMARDEKYISITSLDRIYWFSPVSWQKAMLPMLEPRKDFQ